MECKVWSVKCGAWSTERRLKVESVKCRVEFSKVWYTL